MMRLSASLILPKGRLVQRSPINLQNSRTLNYSYTKFPSLQQMPHLRTKLQDLNIRAFASIPNNKNNVPVINNPNSSFVPKQYEAFAQEIHEQTGLAKLKYWGTFGVMTLGATAATELALQQFAGVQGWGLTFLGITAGSALLQYVILRFMGGRQVATSMGGVKVVPGESSDGDWLLSVVNELSNKAGLSHVPTVYMIPTPEKNAFAAGLKAESSVVAVTNGILKTLTRDELKAVLAHEIGHLYNGDSNTSMHLIAINAGFYAALRLGMQMLRTSGGRNQQGGNNQGRYLIGAILTGVGALTYLLGLLYRMAVSRQREFAADACSVAFTGNKNISSALQKISVNQVTDPAKTVLFQPENRLMYSHLYLDNPTQKAKNLLRFLSTHPPLEERIARVASYDENYFNKLVNKSPIKK